MRRKMMIMWMVVFWAGGGIAATEIVLKGGETGMAELEVVPWVDVNRYAGRWYAVEEIPQFFSRACAGGTTATYTVRPDGALDVYNACYRRDGSLYDIKGVAWVVDSSTNAKLKVSFLPGGLRLRWLAGDYYIIDLGPNYEYAVVGHPSRTYGWILSRTPQLPEDVLDKIHRRLTAQGYDLSLFQRINHQDFPPSSP